MDPSRRGAVLLATVGTALVLMYAASAAVQILLWNPLAAVPGASIEQIRSETTAMNQPLGESTTIAVLAIGVVLALGALAFTLVMSSVHRVVVCAVYLSILVFGAPGYFIASFGPGMSLADAYLISGGDHAPWGAPLYVTSFLAAVALAVLGLAVALRSAIAQSGRVVPTRTAQ